MKNTIYIILAGSLWGIISLFIKVLNEAGLNSMQCVAVRSFFTVVLLFFYLLLTDKNKFKIQLKDFFAFAAMGICSIVFFNFCYFNAIELMGEASVPALLLYTAPTFVIIMSALFFHEKITREKLFSLFLTFIGLGFVTGAFTGGSQMTVIAFLFGIGSGFGYALYSIFGKLVVDKYLPLTVTFYVFLVASVVTVPLSGIVTKIEVFSQGRVLVAVLGLAFVSTVLPYLFYNKGLSGMEAGKASILATVEPLVATILGVFVFHEVFSIEKMMGIILILGGIILLNIRKQKAK